MIPVMANLLREPGILVTTADAVPVDMMMFPAMDGARLVLPVRLLPPRPLARRMIRLAVVAKVDLAHPVVRPAVPLEEMEMVVTIALMSMDCSLLIFVLRVRCPTMGYFVRDVAATVPVLLREIVCLATTDVAGNPVGGGSGPERRSQDGQDGREDDQKAKCKRITLEKEPAPNQLRAWIVDLKEKVANAFAYDTEYALKWVEIPEDADYESLSAPCKYGDLENECNAALRNCVTSPPLKAKIGMETERVHSLSKRLVSRQILWMLWMLCEFARVLLVTLLSKSSSSCDCRVIDSPRVPRRKGLKRS